LTLATAAGDPIGLASADPPTADPVTVAIIGAGLAGLRVASLLERAGVDYRLIEARDRLGGRILTVGADGVPGQGFDLGPSWYWPQMQPAIGALVEELGLRSFGQHGEGDVIFERMSREPARRYAARQQEPQSMRLAGGTAELVDALARTLPTGMILMDTRVTAMRLANDGVTLSLENGTRPCMLHARYVVAALPPRLLDDTVDFEPELSAATRGLWQGTATWMAPHAKFVAIYDYPFWRDAGMSGTAQSMVGPMVEMHDATTDTGEAALFGFIGLPADERLLAGETLLKRACVEQLVRLFGESAGNPRSILLKDWAGDPLTATMKDRTPSGHAPANETEWVAGEWHERLVLAGSETSSSEPGYLAGAVIAAERAVERVLGFTSR
jgi:monoamine oxidase